ncbi:hypothetical protein GOODEAATRI_006947 [Goodea atripinnis]|uniref:Uncharacterized protein n=1 Tax=Goodea atripinnis TaxID=208336 RepID=A0ABV0PVY8_9TELE
MNLIYIHCVIPPALSRKMYSSRGHFGRGFIELYQLQNVLILTFCGSSIFYSWFLICIHFSPPAPVCDVRSPFPSFSIILSSVLASLHFSLSSVCLPVSLCATVTVKAVVAEFLMKQQLAALDTTSRE